MKDDASKGYTCLYKERGGVDLEERMHNSERLNESIKEFVKQRREKELLRIEVMGKVFL